MPENIIDLLLSHLRLKITVGLTEDFSLEWGH